MSIGKRELAGALAALALAVLGSSMGCRSEHLGKDTGRAYRNALETQAASTSEGPSLSADDAARVMSTHSSSKGKQSGDAAAPTATPTAPISSGSLSSGGAWPGATGNISLEAK